LPVFKTGAFNRSATLPIACAQALRRAKKSESLAYVGPFVGGSLLFCQLYPHNRRLHEANLYRSRHESS
jgi:hypothetical protein